LEVHNTAQLLAIENKLNQDEMYRSLFSALALAAGAHAATQVIDVGKGGSLAFSPNSLTAAMGDMLEFHFFSGSGGHSVVSSTFDSPCVPAPDAFFSGYQKADSTGDTTFVVNVTSTDPIWFYCSLASHCQEGMAGVVNPPSGQTLSDYTNAAMKVAHASAPAGLTGGSLTTISEAAASTSASSTEVRTGNQVTSGSSNPGGPFMSATGSSPTSSTVRTGVQASQATSTSGVVTGTGSTETPAATSKSDARRTNDMSVVFGLSVVIGGLVVLMS